MEQSAFVLRHKCMPASGARQEARESLSKTERPLRDPSESSIDPSELTDADRYARDLDVD